jgi:hypothetical protein
LIVISIVALILMLTGNFMFFRISPAELAESFIKQFQVKRSSLRDKVRKATKKKKLRGINKLITETKDILAITNKTGRFSFLCLVSMLLSIAGTLIGLITANLLLIPVLACGLFLIPFWYVIFTANFYKKHLSNELETALSVITTSYLRTENILTAVQENITYLNPPVDDVFKWFLAQTLLISSNIKLALESLKEKVDNNVFREWCDALIACQEDKNLKSTLLPIVLKLSDMRIVGAELDYMLYNPLKEFVTMAILLIGNIPLMFFLNRDWFNTLVFTEAGKLILAVAAIVLFVSLSAAIRISKTIEYRR